MPTPNRTCVSLTREGFSPRPAINPKFNESAAEAAVKILFTGICGSDIHVYDRRTELTGEYFLGHEAVGLVTDVSSPDHAQLLGSTVVVEPAIGCGVCATCRTGLAHLCPQGRFLGTYGLRGSLASNITLPISNCMPLPAAIASPLAGLLVEPLAVVFHALGLTRRSYSSLVVIGGGPIGALVAQVVSTTCPEVMVVVSELSDWRREFVRRYGVEVCEPDRLFDAVHAAGATLGVDVVVEAATASTTSIQLACDVLRPGGCLIVIGIGDTAVLSLPRRMVLEKGLTVKFARRAAQSDMRKGMNHLLENVSALSDFVTDLIPLYDVSRAFEKAGRLPLSCMKVALQHY